MYNDAELDGRDIGAPTESHCPIQPQPLTHPPLMADELDKRKPVGVARTPEGMIVQ